MGRRESVRSAGSIPVRFRYFRWSPQLLRGDANAFTVGAAPGAVRSALKSSGRVGATGPGVAFVAKASPGDDLRRHQGLHHAQHVVRAGGHGAVLAAAPPPLLPKLTNWLFDSALATCAVSSGAISRRRRSR